MKAWINLLRDQRQWLRWPVLAAVGLAVTAASFHFSVVRPAQDELAALQRKIVALRAQHPIGAPGSRQNPRLQLVRFYESFPSESHAPNWLARVYAAAQSNRLELLRGDYRTVRDGQRQLTEYRITLPLKGNYPNIRGFLNTVLSELPSIALDNVACERQKIGESTVQVTVRLTLYLRDEP